MPTINLQPSVYEDLQDLMVEELKEKLKEKEIEKSLIELAKNKFGITFNTMVTKLIYHYKKTK